MIVKESIFSFTRGSDPKKTLGIGSEQFFLNNPGKLEEEIYSKIEEIIDPRWKTEMGRNYIRMINIADRPIIRIFLPSGLRGTKKNDLIEETQKYIKELVPSYWVLLQQESMVELPDPKNHYNSVKKRKVILKLTKN